MCLITKKLRTALILLFVVIGCGEGHKLESSEKREAKYTDEQIVYKGETKLWNFDGDDAGKIPNGFSNQITGKGGPGKWEIVRDETAPSRPHILAQTSQDDFGYHFNMAVNEKETYDNFELIVKFKGVKGSEDQGGGPVWRYKDSNNYYIARANPLENNFRVYKVVNGKRIQMGSVRLKIASNTWHTIKIITLKDNIQCYYDGSPYLDVNDNTFQKGKIGLWTKADAVTYFDDLEVRPIK